MKCTLALAAGLMLMGGGMSVHAIGAGGNGDHPERLNRDSQATQETRATVRRMARGSDYIGKAVVNSRRETLGEIIDLAINGTQRRVIYAVLGSGGLFGIGQTLHAVPLSAFNKAAAGDDLVFDISKTRLDAQPGFDDDHWPAKANNPLIERSVSGASTLRSPGSQAPGVTKPTDKGGR